MMLPEGMLELNAPLTAEEKEQQKISNKKCHPERSKFASLAKRVAESKDPYPGPKCSGYSVRTARGRSRLPHACGLLGFRDEDRHLNDLSGFFSRTAGLRNCPPGPGSGLAEIEVHDLREFAHDRHRTVDDRPFGGGEGMVLKPEPIFECIEGLNIQSRAERCAPVRKQSVVLLSAQGRRFDQRVAEELAALERLS